MDKNKIMKRNEPRKVVPINIRITKALSDWLKEKKYSPTGIFVEACFELGYQKKEE